MTEPALPEWFDDLLQRYHNQLLAFACAILRDEQQAHNITQEVFVAAWRAAVLQKAPFTASLNETETQRWLFQVAYHRSISKRRHERIIVWESLDLLDSPAVAERSSAAAFEDRVAEGDALAAALARLSPLDAACVLLHVVHGFTAAVVARIIEINPVATKKRLWRAIERLRIAYFACERAVVGEQERR